jgi:hypothetical protein
MCGPGLKAWPDESANSIFVHLDALARYDSICAVADLAPYQRWQLVSTVLA